MLKRKIFWYLYLYFTFLASVIYLSSIFYSYATAPIAKPAFDLNPLFVVYIFMSGFIFAALTIAPWRIFFVISGILIVPTALLYWFIYLSGQDSGDGFGLLGFYYALNILLIITIHLLSFITPAKLLLIIPNVKARVLAFLFPLLIMVVVIWNFRGTLSSSPLDCEKIISLNKKDRQALFDASSSLGTCIYRRMGNNDPSVCAKFGLEHSQYACKAYFFIKEGGHEDCFALDPLWQSDPCFLSLASKMNERRACDSIFSNYHHRECLQRFPSN